ncbi:MAG: efflux transporter outer membrane subunit [Curvibacter sp.]|nr:efflux transporter outer membrane subunit [Curvibacter sp.]
MKPRLSLLCLALSLSACSAVGPDFRRPDGAGLPAQYLEPGGGQSVSAVWQQLLADPVLADLQQAALRDNPDFAVALLRVQQARADQAVQDAGSGPSVGLTAQNSQDRISRNSELFANAPPVGNLRTRFSNSQIGFDASWEIDLFGHQRRLSEAALARTEALQERAQDARLSLLAEVARQYLALRLAQQRGRLAQAQLDDLDSEVAITRIAVEHGELARSDLQRLLAQRDNFAAGLPNLAQAERQALAALSTLCAMAGAELQRRLAETWPLPEVPPPPATGLPADLLRQRPDVRAAERDWAAASADVGVATALQYPQVSLVGHGGWQSVSQGALLDPASRDWSFGPSLSLPLFNSDRLAGQVRSREAALKAAEVSYRKAVQAALADVEVALSRMAQSEHRRGQLLRSQAEQAELLRLTELQLQAGDSSRLNVLEARRSLNSQQDQVLQAQGESLTALVAICKSLGGGWAAP